MRSYKPFNGKRRERNVYGAAASTAAPFFPPIPRLPLWGSCGAVFSVRPSAPYLKSCRGAIFAAYSSAPPLGGAVTLPFGVTEGVRPFPFFPVRAYNYIAHFLCKNNSLMQKFRFPPRRRSAPFRFVGRRKPLLPPQKISNFLQYISNSYIMYKKILWRNLQKASFCGHKCLHNFRICVIIYAPIIS